MDSARAKVLVMGPKKCGKTRISNFLSGHEESPDFSSAYKPTKGTRILEFEENVQTGKGRGMQLAVELWDCSGDEQYNSCWPAILRDVSGVVLVYDPTVKEQEKDIETWYKSFVARLGLKDAQVLLFAHSGGAPASTRSSYQAPRSLDKFNFLNTTLDNEESTAAMKQAFTQFLGAVAVGAAEAANAAMDASLDMATR